MDVWTYLLNGFAEALTWENLLFALVGCLTGTLLGVLPGIGATAGIAILIPLTVALDPISAIIMLAAIFYGGAYGGTITSVLLNVPGESETAITAIDGYQMTRHGRGGIALTVAGLGSWIGGTFSIILIILAAPFLARVGLLIGPPEYTAIVLVGMSLIVGLVGKSLTLGAISAGIGFLIGMVGLDPVAGIPRFTFGDANLLDGVSVIPILVGLFGLGEILYSAGPKSNTRVRAPRLRELIPTWRDLRRAAPAIATGTVIGSGTGLVPGISGTISTVLSYSAQRHLSKHKAEFGSGAIEGVAAPESANNAHSNASFIPLFFLGIPASASLALLTGAFSQHGLTPGPRLLTDHPEVVWTVIASLFIGNTLLLVLNVPLVGIWTRVLLIPYPVLTSIIFAFIIIGSFSINASTFDVGVMIVFGVIGWIFRRLGIPPAPLVLALILGPILELALRQSLQISHGSFSIFVNRPIALAFIVIAVLVLVISGFGDRLTPKRLRGLMLANRDQ